MTPHRKTEYLADDTLDAAVGGASGIHALATLSQLKVTRANDETLDGAQSQRDAVAQRKKTRQQKKSTHLSGRIGLEA